MTQITIIPDRVLLEHGFVADMAVTVHGERIVAVGPIGDSMIGKTACRLDGDLLPGFVDLQVNGGGGVLFNDALSVDGIEAIGSAHRRFGTTAFLPTLISDNLAAVEKAIRAVDDAIERKIPGVLGIHLEGPYLNAARRGIHDSTKFRALDEDALDLICSLKRGRTLITLAPEQANPSLIAELVARGVTVAAGHTAASYDVVKTAIKSGLTGFTHLFNAMPPFQSREPGPIGAAFEASETWASVIADGAHLHPATLRLIARHKLPDKLILVTDAMPSVGSDLTSFRLGETEVRVEAGRCVAADGTLAGAHLDMFQAVSNAMEIMAISFPQAVAMATINPARAVSAENDVGSIRVGARANMILLDRNRTIAATWIDGHRLRS